MASRISRSILLVLPLTLVPFAIANCSSSTTTNDGTASSTPDATDIDASLSDGAEPEGAADAGASDGANVDANDAPSDAADAAGPFVLRTASVSVPMLGKVVDVLGAPVSNAQVALTPNGGGTTVNTVSDVSGAFRGMIAAGRVTVTVTRDGFVPWHQVVPLTTTATPLLLTLATASAAQSVPASGGTVTAGPVSLAFPSGAYSSATDVSATWLDKSKRAAMSTRAWWYDDAGLHHTLGELHVAVATEPAASVSVTVPIPSGVTTPKYYPLAANGTLESGIAPTSFAGGFATFSVPHFDAGIVADDAPAATGADLVSGACSYVDPITSQSVSTSVGDFIPSGASVTPTNPSDVLVFDFSDGSRFMLSDTGFTFTDDGTSGTITTTGDEPSLTGEVPHLPATVQQPPKRFQIHTKTAVIGVRGTAFSFAAHDCPSSTTRTLSYVDVAEGTVDVDNAAGSTTVDAGQEAASCNGCANPSNPTCCDSSNCASGCCTADQRCVAGTADSACGKGGVACQACVSSATAGCTAQQTCGNCGGISGPCCAGNTCHGDWLDGCLNSRVALACSPTTLTCCVSGGNTAEPKVRCCSGASTPKQCGVPLHYESVCN